MTTETGPEQLIYICSDSVGETAEAVTRATLRQFGQKQVRTQRIGHIERADQIRSIIREAAERRSFVAYTFVRPELREAIKEESVRYNVRTVDIMGPMLEAFSATFRGVPKPDPGLQREMDEEYFKRIESVEFSVRYDDGKDPKGLPQAHVVLVGVSRTSKTPLSMFLAFKGLKVANWPLVPEVPVPKELEQVKKDRLFGLTMSAEAILKIRKERLKAIGLPTGASYADIARIEQELHHSLSVMERLGCRIIDVTDKAIEETAGVIIDSLT